MMLIKPLDRRSFLRGAGGVAIALPFLEAMTVHAATAGAPKRMVCVGSTLGFVPGEFFPTQGGPDFALPRLLEPLAGLRDRFTVFSGMDHGTNAQNGHAGAHAFLSGVLTTNAASYPEKNISVDQRAAEFVGPRTRYPSLQLSPKTDKANKMSWSRAGVALTPIESLQSTFDLLFKQEDKDRLKLDRARLQASQSILDVVVDDARDLSSTLGNADRERLDHYLTSVRDLELRLTQSKQWLDVPKPSSDYALSRNADQLLYTERLQIFYDLIALALQTDSTRVVTLELSSLGGENGGFDISEGHHALTHHGKLQSKLDQLHIVELFHMQAFANFLTKLDTIREIDGTTLLDSTMALIGSGLGNASSHSNRSIPLLLAGGGFRHLGHHAVPAAANGSDAALAGNIFLSMLQNFGLEIDRFNAAKNTVTGLEFV